MFKIMGAILILFSSGMFGQYFSSKEKYALEDLYNFKKGFLLLASEISYLRTPLSNAFEKISKNLGIGVKDFFKDFSFDLENSNSIDMKEIWQNSFYKHKSKLYLSEDIQSHIKDFGIILENQDCDLIIKNIDMLIVQLENEIEYCIVRNEQTKKMYKQLSLLFGCLLIVLFI